MDWLVFFAFVPAVVAAYVLRLFRLEAPQVRLPSSPPSRPGLWFLSHRADRRFPFQHLFIRITPRDPDWASRRPDLFSRRDEDGRPYCTLGAGPRGGKLFLEFNRGFDLGDPVSFEEQSPSPGLADENARIEVLLSSAGTYGQALDFTAWSRVSGRGYNCNSIIRALADRSGLDMPRFSRRLLLCPGAGRAIPREAFHEGRPV